MASSSLSTSDASNQLVIDLLDLSKRNHKLVKSTIHQAPQDPDVKIRSWKMNEFKYYDVPSPFPTLARGLFTTWVGDSHVDKEGEGPGKHAIVVRGYDKFFNIGEVPWTNWTAIEKHTKAPYAVTLKSNGCIIFIAALSPTKLVITSKHSIGSISGVPISHAEMGEQWLREHLKSAGKTVEDLASTLLQKKWTAVAELCDDSFEEHVLAIPKTKTGLHLHGLNSNDGAFSTQPSDIVNVFAKEWGFIETAFVTFDTATEVKEFTDEAAKTGKWNGEAVEGFVVRALIKDDTSKDRDSPPYPPGSSFFFKVKFDEPYMMYRDWRELTRSMIAAQTKGQEAKISRGKLARLETRVYMNWVRGELTTNKEAFKDFQKGKGIIAVRDKFLKYLETPEGQEQLAKEGGTTVAASTGTGPTASGSNSAPRERKRGEKFAIVPIAIPGCGKTAIGVALAHLFDFGHVQNDDIKEKKTAPVFNRNLTASLRKHDVVYADRNNHLQRHRQDIREHLGKGFGSDKVRLIALNWGLNNMPIAAAHRITADRISGRGANHQTLRPDQYGKHEEIIWTFIGQREELGENEVDDIIEMELDENFEDSLMRAINGIVELIGWEKPSQEKFGEVLRLVNSYQTSTRNERGGNEGHGKKKDSGPRYFGILPEIDLEALLDSRLVEESAPKSAFDFWKALKSNKRFAQRPHITLVHNKSLPTEQSTWDACSSIALASTQPTFNLKLGHLVWNDRVMALTVDDIALVEGGGEDEGKKWLDELPEDVRNRLHVTVGTKHPTIFAFEAKALVEAWKGDAGEPKVYSLPLNPPGEEVVSAKGRVKGLFQ